MQNYKRQFEPVHAAASVGPAQDAGVVLELVPDPSETVNHN